MRLVLAALVLTSLTGCLNTRFGNLFTPREREKDTGPLPAVPAKTALVEYLNANSDRVTGMRVENMTVSVSQGFRPPISLDAKMLVEKPRNVLFQADFLSKTMFSVGSNQNEFWFWNSQDRSPKQYYCSYQDFQEGRFPAELPVSFQPEWLLEVMGLGNYGSPERYTLESDNRHIRLVEKTRTPQGRPIRKIIVLNRREVQIPSPQVVAFLLVDDSTNKELVSVKVTETQLAAVDASRAAILPKRMEIHMHQDNVKLALHFGSIKLNPEANPGLFVRRPLPGVESVDLGKLGGPAVQQTQSQR